MRRTFLALVSMMVVALSSSCGKGGSGDGGTTQPASVPTIAFSASGVVFSAASGTASPAAQTINITNSGTGTLSALATGTIVYGSGQTGGWLTASLNSPTAPTTLTLTPTTGALLAGSYSATIPISSSASGITNSPQSVTASVTVSAGAATHLVFTTQPPATGSGSLSPSVIVTIEDAVGNVVTTATTSITMAFGTNTAGATLGGTTTVAAIAGVATFSTLSANKAGTGYTLVASATGLTSATSTAFNVVVAAATQLAFTTQPSSATTGIAIAPAIAVAIKDASGNTVVSATNSVTLAIGTNPAAGTLSGTLTVAAVAGVATFNNVVIGGAGAGYTLVAQATGLTSATSNSFTITAVATAVSLTLGQSQSFLVSPNFAAALAVQPGAQYLVEVVNTDASSAQTENFQFNGTFVASVAASRFGTTAGSAASTQIQTAASAPRSGAAQELSPQLQAAQRAAQTHLSALEHSRQVYARFGNPNAGRALRGPTGQISASITPSVIVQTIGTVNKIYVANSLNGGCSSVDSIGARTVAVGTHVIVLADTNLTKWPQSLRPDTSFYASFAAEYDSVTWPHLLTYIGNPLADDANLSGIGKVTIVLTPTLNNLKGPAGGGTAVAFVNSCDFYVNRSAQIGNGFSNNTEITYSLVPSASSFSVAQWEQELRATVSHESKHIVSFASRIINNSPSFEETWLEEGLAQVSSEIWMRHFNQATWLGHATLEQTVDCELNFSPCTSPNTPPQALYLSHLPFLFQYLLTEGTTNAEGLNIDTPSDYGAGWIMGRYVTDQYAAGNEGGFIQSLISDPSRTGLTNLSFHTGASIPALLVNWNLALATYTNPAVAAADVHNSIPSFNLAEIFFKGQTSFTCNGVKCGLFSPNESQTPNLPLTPFPFSTAAAFTHSSSGVPGTSAVYMLLTGGAAGTETLQLLGTGGAPLSASSGFRVAIIRVQ